MPPDQEALQRLLLELQQRQGQPLYGRIPEYTLPLPPGDGFAAAGTPPIPPVQPPLPSPAAGPPPAAEPSWFDRGTDRMAEFLRSQMLAGSGLEGLVGPPGQPAPPADPGQLVDMGQQDYPGSLPMRFPSEEPAAPEGEYMLPQPPGPEGPPRAHYRFGEKMIGRPVKEAVMGGLEALGGATESGLEWLLTPETTPEYRAYIEKQQAMEAVRGGQAARETEAQVAAAAASPDLTAPVAGLPPEDQLPGEYQLPPPPPSAGPGDDEIQRARALMEMSTQLHRGAQAPFEGGGGGFTGAEEVAAGAEELADTDAGPRQVEGPGDLARDKAERKLAFLTAARDVAEGFGRLASIPVKGTYTTGGQPPAPFRAEGIRDLMKQEGLNIRDLADEDKLRIQSELRGKETTARLDQMLENAKDLQKSGAGYGMDRIKAMEKMRQDFATTQETMKRESTKLAEKQKQIGREASIRLTAALKPFIPKALTAETMTKISAQDMLVDELTKVLQAKGKYNTGPVIAMFEGVLENFIGDYAYGLSKGGIDKAAYKGALRNVLSQMVRAVEGGRPSDEDRRFLKKVSPQITDDDGILVKKAIWLRDWAKENKKRLVTLLEQSGYAIGKNLPGGGAAAAPAATGATRTTADPPGPGEIRIRRGTTTQDVPEVDFGSIWEPDGWVQVPYP